MKLSKAQVNSDLDLKAVVYWGDVLYNTVVVAPDKTLTIGKVPGNSIVMPAEESYHRDRLTLVKVLKDNSAAELCFDETIQGRVYLGDEFLRLNAAVDAGRTILQPDGTHQILMHSGDRAEFVIGHLTVSLEWVTDRQVIPRMLVKDNRKSLIATGLLVLGMMICSLMLYLIEPPEEPPPERLVKIQTRRPVVQAKAAIGEKKTETGGTKTGDLGKAKIKPKPEKTEAEKLRQALSGDFVKDLADVGTQAPRKTASTPDEAVAAALDQASTGGSSTKGFKTGGGGKSAGLGRTTGQGTGGFEGTGRLGLAGNSVAEGGSGRGEYDVVEKGGLDRDVIDAIVRKKKDRIRLCYERQLNFKPDLAGKVGIRFVIGPQGNVLKAGIGEDTMNNSAVNRCITEEVKTWQFPHPKGGTQVNVDYPFVFESSVKR